MISAVGDESESAAGPKLLKGTVRSMIMPSDLPPPPQEVYATGFNWYRDNTTLTFQGYRYIKYGIPRPLNAAERGRLVIVGWFARMAVYAEKQYAHGPAVIYVPTGPNEFQPYQAHRDTCD